MGIYPPTAQINFGIYDLCCKKMVMRRIGLATYASVPILRAHHVSCNTTLRKALRGPGASSGSSPCSSPTRIDETQLGINPFRDGISWTCLRFLFYFVDDRRLHCLDLNQFLIPSQPWLKILQDWRPSQFQDELGRSTSCNWRVTTSGLERFDHMKHKNPIKLSAIPVPSTQ